MIKQSIPNCYDSEYEVTLYYSYESKGRGGFNIICKFDFGGVGDTLKVYTTDTHFIDELNRLKEDESFEAIQETYHKKFFEEFKEQIENFCDLQVAY